jgi:hypothetical protein
VRLPQALDALVQEHLRTTGTPFATLVRDALAAHLADSAPTGTLTPADSSADTLRMLQGQLAAVTTRLEEIESTLVRVRQLADRFADTPADTPADTTSTAADMALTPADRSSASPAVALSPQQQGRKDAVSRELLEAVAAIRRQYPHAPLRALSDYLYEHGIYRSRTKSGRRGRASHSLVARWLQKATEAGLLP